MPAVATVCPLPTESKNKKRLPVTLLSGFLGSGKTTLLQHILRNKQNLRCAVIVNDMASINIDAALIEKNTVLQREETMVKLQNGCICCTLRGDLLVEVARLAESGDYDYLVIESTGISEPMQVAETFAMDEDELRQMQPTDSEEYILEQLKPLAGIAKLDTCVTILDATQVFTYFDAAEYLAQRFKEADTMDERTVSDLLCDQIEFADVIMINKIDLATPEMVKRCEDLVRTLNPRAIVHKTRHSKIDMKHILNTGRFDFAQAAMSPGWLQSLKEPIVPETQEYGIGSFVYRARKPFHPDRLFQLLNQYFILLETGGDVPEDGEEGDGEEDCGDVEEGDEDGDAEEGEDDEDTGIDQEVATERLQKKQTSPFRGLLRSKGFVWLATRNDMMGEWSQAGLVLTMSSGGPWFASLPEEDWPEEKVIRDEIMKDYDENTGDRRQELVFIGQVTNEEAEALIKLLDGCLVTDHEWTQYQNGEMDSWEDPWEPWVDAGRDEEEEDEDMGDL